MTSLPLLLTLALTPPAAQPPAAQPSVSAAGLTATWQLEGAHLLVELTAPTTGWVLIGFNDREALAGSRLVMAAMTPDGPVVEEHVAAPPSHAARTTGARASLIDLVVEGGQTRARVKVPLDPEDPALPRLTPGQRSYVWLAWSRSPDLQHHSAQREGLWVRL